MRANSDAIVVVAVLTYRRPETLRRLLESLVVLVPPVCWQVRFLIVDNDPEASAAPIVEATSKAFHGALHYVVEPEPGIPAARNRALDEASKIGARLLAFIDDDEYPDPDWLRELLAHRKATGAVLIGGPVRLLPPDSAEGIWRSFLARSLLAHSKFMESWYNRSSRKGRLLKLATNNWLGDLSWINENGVRFDPALRFTGGSDTTFLVAVQSRGGKVSWCERAVVYEYLPASRNRLGYQFGRFRTYGLTKARLRRGSSPVQVVRMTAGAGLMLVPVLGWASFIVGLQMFATGFGWFAGLRGVHSSHYAREEADASIEIA